MEEHNVLHFEALGRNGRNDDGPVSDFGQNVFHQHGLAPSPTVSRSPDAPPSTGAATGASKADVSSVIANGGAAAIFDTSPISKWESEYNLLADKGRTMPDGFTQANRFLLGELESAERGEQWQDYEKMVAFASKRMLRAEVEFSLHRAKMLRRQNKYREAYEEAAQAAKSVTLSHKNNSNFLQAHHLHALLTFEHFGSGSNRIDGMNSLGKLVEHGAGAARRWALCARASLMMTQGSAPVYSDSDRRNGKCVASKPGGHGAARNSSSAFKPGLDDKPSSQKVHHSSEACADLTQLIAILEAQGCDALDGPAVAAAAGCTSGVDDVSEGSVAAASSSSSPASCSASASSASVSSSCTPAKPVTSLKEAEAALRNDDDSGRLPLWLLLLERGRAHRRVCDWRAACADFDAALAQLRTKGVTRPSHSPEASHALCAAEFECILLSAEVACEGGDADDLERAYTDCTFLLGQLRPEHDAKEGTSAAAAAIARGPPSAANTYFKPTHKIERRVRNAPDFGRGAFDSPIIDLCALYTRGHVLLRLLALARGAKDKADKQGKGARKIDGAVREAARTVLVRIGGDEGMRDSALYDLVIHDLKAAGSNKKSRSDSISSTSSSGAGGSGKSSKAHKGTLANSMSGRVSASIIERREGEKTQIERDLEEASDGKSNAIADELMDEFGESEPQIMSTPAKKKKKKKKKKQRQE